MALVRGNLPIREQVEPWAFYPNVQMAYPNMPSTTTRGAVYVPAKWLPLVAWKPDVFEVTMAMKGLRVEYWERDKSKKSIQYEGLVRLEVKLK